VPSSLIASSLAPLCRPLVCPSGNGDHPVLAGSTVAVRITAAEDPGECVAVVEGEVDLLSAPLVAEHLASCVGGGCRRLTVDLSGVSFLGASGLSVLVAASEDLGRSGGLLVLHRSRPLTRRMFAITGIDQLPHIEVSDCSVVSDDR